MITGAHVIIYSSNPAADRKFFKDVLKFPNVDVGEGWLIFGLPPSEMAVHPSDENGTHEFYLVCSDIIQFLEEMAENNILCSPVETQPWGLLSHVTLPGGGRLGVYEARHERPGG